MGQQTCFLSKKRPHEIKFRKNGFDRDLMRRLGFNLENVGNNKPNNWVLVNKENLGMPAKEMLFQKVTGQKKKRSKRTKRRPKRRTKRR